MAALVVTRSTVTPWSRSSSATARLPDGSRRAGRAGRPRPAASGQGEHQPAEQHDQQHGDRALGGAPQVAGRRVGGRPAPGRRRAALTAGSAATAAAGRPRTRSSTARSAASDSGPAGRPPYQISSKSRAAARRPAATAAAPRRPRQPPRPRCGRAARRAPRAPRATGRRPAAARAPPRPTRPRRRARRPRPVLGGGAGAAR